ncbi:MAG TPA: DUF5675 family protein [Chitinophagaceae bacterium]|nr:DUF5675 family protein [Chitinophagaceae bacterium]
MELELIRTYYPNGTNGDLLLNGDKICSTIELPWKENKPQVSCIPEGKYELKKRYTPRFGNHFILMNVPNRSFILLHAANDALKEMRGCIAPDSFLTGEGKGTQARAALAKVVKAVNPELEKGNQVFLTIQSKKNGYSNQKNEAKDAKVL